jgi:adenylate kinase
MQVQQIVESGKLVDDDVILSCLESALKSLHLQEDSVILLDGIPRNLAQAAGLDTLLARFNGHVNKVISLQSDLENLLERFSKRWTCSVCNKVESIVQAQDISSYKCSSCGSMGSMLRRKDDDLQTAKHRFSVYQEETLPLISYYQDRGVFESIDALLSPEIVYIKAASILLQM